mmetsp:Transcript_7439/g.26560  ORF Transcript_7439/g.26560 Transcript_7439/m.26560 type:complete len:353 (+) Transcript_7439:1903-2961(+)
MSDTDRRRVGPGMPTPPSTSTSSSSPKPPPLASPLASPSDSPVSSACWMPPPRKKGSSTSLPSVAPSSSPWWCRCRSACCRALPSALSTRSCSVCRIFWYAGGCRKASAASTLAVACSREEPYASSFSAVSASSSSRRSWKSACATAGCCVSPSARSTYCAVVALTRSVRTAMPDAKNRMRDDVCRCTSGSAKTKRASTSETAPRRPPYTSITASLTLSPWPMRSSTGMRKKTARPRTRCSSRYSAISRPKSCPDSVDQSMRSMVITPVSTKTSVLAANVSDAQKSCRRCSTSADTRVKPVYANQNPAIDTASTPLSCADSATKKHVYAVTSVIEISTSGSLKTVPSHQQAT